ncbi:MAG TPA: Hsp20/alpha crystallin family protein [Elusimicrobiales bacterium]|nr:Hsp20/alpha crystallin family protein [Elusimicrobiales bacterium]
MSSKNIVNLKPQSATALRPFDSLGRVFEDLFDLPLVHGGVNSPRIDIRETDKEVQVSAALPGVEKKDINLDLTENSLAVSCERREEKEEKGEGGYRLKEQSYGRFYRSFALPAPVKTGEAKAEYKDGALRVILPKQKTAKGRQINID